MAYDAGNTGWTDERVETLKRLWTEGKSAEQIARRIGGVTRSAVIGKVHRLGLIRVPDDSSWTEERVEVLKRLWTEGKSLKEISVALGGVTQSAVMGKVRRLDLQKRVTPVRPVRLRRWTPAVKARLSELWTAGIVTSQIAATLNREFGQAFTADAVSVQRANIGLPPRPQNFKPRHLSTETAFTPQEPEQIPATACKLMDLDDGQCRWPVSGSRADTLYCGKQTGSKRKPYCCDHAQKSAAKSFEHGPERKAERLGAYLGRRDELGHRLVMSTSIAEVVRHGRTL